MRLRRRMRQSFTGPNFEALFRRINNLGTDEITDLLDITLSTLNKYIPEYRRGKNPELLAEAKLGAEALYVMISELESRSKIVSEIAPTRQLRNY